MRGRASHGDCIATYGAVIRFIGDKDPTTRRLLEDILAVEEEHADELADYLKKFPE
ncbi:MAG: ferritin-like domain-containing protein [Myxococcaceae bacterium]